MANRIMYDDIVVADVTECDSSLSSSSTNPLQNKVIKTALDGKVPTTRKVNNKALSSDITLTASDIGISTMTDQEIEDAVNAGWTTNYTVQISLTNPVNPSGFMECGIFKLCTDDEYDADSEYIGSITSPTGSTTVTLDDSAPYVAIVFQSYYSVATDYSAIGTTGGVAWDGNTWTQGTIICVVTGDGTITVANVDYDD